MNISYVILIYEVKFRVECIKTTLLTITLFFFYYTFIIASSGPLGIIFFWASSEFCEFIALFEVYIELLNGKFTTGN